MDLIISLQVEKGLVMQAEYEQAYQRFKQSTPNLVGVYFLPEGRTLLLTESDLAGAVVRGQFTVNGKTFVTGMEKADER